MTRSIFWLTIGSWLSVVGTVAAQQGVGSVPGGGKDPAAGVQGPDSVSMYEDIEIFRRILEETLVPHGVSSAAHAPMVAFSPDGRILTRADDYGVRLWDANTGKQMGAPVIDPHREWTERMAEGVYVPGYGVLYTATLPGDFRVPVRNPAEKRAQPVSRWERTRDELRGKKVEAGEKQSPREEPSLAEAVLQALAENGRHFSKLGDGEHLTVVLTLSPKQACIRCHAAHDGPPKAGVAPRNPPVIGRGGPALSGGASFSGGSSSGGFSGGSFSGGGFSGGSFSGGSFSGGGFSGGSFSGGGFSGGGESQGERQLTQNALQAQRLEGTNYARLGDMRLKQGRSRESAEAFQKAIDVYRKLLARERIRSGEDKEFEADRAAAAEVGAKLAQAYLLLGESDKAVSALKGTFARYPVTAGNKGASERSESTAPAELPAKLIISAPKRLLEQVGSGKMSFDEFRKAASVQYLTFATPEKGSGAPAAGNPKP